MSDQRTMLDIRMNLQRVMDLLREYEEDGLTVRCEIHVSEEDDYIDAGIAAETSYGGAFSVSAQIAREGADVGTRCGDVTEAMENMLPVIIDSVPGLGLTDPNGLRSALYRLLDEHTLDGVKQDLRNIDEAAEKAPIANAIRAFDWRTPDDVVTRWKDAQRRNDRSAKHTALQPCRDRLTDFVNERSLLTTPPGIRRNELLIETLHMIYSAAEVPENVMQVQYQRLGELEPRAMSWERFVHLAAGFYYDAGYGLEMISHSLVILGRGWMLKRESYDGNEGWVEVRLTEPLPVNDDEATRFDIIEDAELCMDALQDAGWEGWR